jgi:hypothetical protein
MVEYIGGSVELNFHQRWASYLTIIVTIVGLAGGFFLRTRTLEATDRFENKEAGIAVQYPTNWLLEENGSDFVLRARDQAAVPFKTTLQISLLTVGSGARLSDIPDLLNITRALTLSTYQPLGIQPITLPNGAQALQMDYAYVASETNPFLQSLPIVVQARDVIVLRSNQALIVTFRSDAQSFNQNQHYFDSFLKALEF